MNLDLPKDPGQEAQGVAIDPIPTEVIQRGAPRRDKGSETQLNSENYANPEDLFLEELSERLGREVTDLTIGQAPEEDIDFAIETASAKFATKDLQNKEVVAAVVSELKEPSTKRRVPEDREVSDEEMSVARAAATVDGRYARYLIASMYTSLSDEAVFNRARNQPSLEPINDLGNRIEIIRGAYSPAHVAKRLYQLASKTVLAYDTRPEAIREKRIDNFNTVDQFLGILYGDLGLAIGRMERIRHGYLDGIDRTKQLQRARPLEQEDPAAEIARLKAELAASKRRETEQAVKISKLEGERDEDLRLKIVAEEEAKALEVELDSAQDELLKMQERLKKGSPEMVASLKAQIEELQRAITQKDLRIERQGVDNSRLVAENDQLQKDKEALDRRIQDLVNQVAQQGTSINNLIDQLQKVRGAGLNLFGREISIAEVNSIRKAMAKLHHPDQGGDQEAMKSWNRLLDTFEQIAKAREANKARY